MVQGLRQVLKHVVWLRGEANKTLAKKHYDKLLPKSYWEAIINITTLLNAQKASEVILRHHTVHGLYIYWKPVI